MSAGLVVLLAKGSLLALLIYMWRMAKADADAARAEIAAEAKLKRKSALEAALPKAPITADRAAPEPVAKR